MTLESLTGGPSHYRMRAVEAERLEPISTAHRRLAQQDPAAFLVASAFALVPIQVSIDGLSFRFAISDLLIAAAAFLVVLNLAHSRIRIPENVVGLPLALAIVVAYAAVVGSIRDTLELSALVDRLAGAGVVGAYLICGYAGGGVAVRAGIRYASVVAIGSHIASSLRLFGLDGDGHRNAGALEDPNNAGLLLAVLFLFSLGNTRKAPSTNRTRMFDVFVSLALLYFLVETGSRSAWVSLAAGLVLFFTAKLRMFLASGRVRPLRFVGLIAASAVGLFLVQGTLVNAVNARLSEIASRPDNVERRFEVYAASYDSFVSNPFTGGGLFHTLVEGFGFPHSSIFWLGGDAGIAGIAVFLAIALVPFARSFKLLVSHPEVAAALTTLIVASFMIEALYQRIWWIVIAVAFVPALSSRVNRLPRTKQGGPENYAPYSTRV